MAKRLAVLVVGAASVLAALTIGTGSAEAGLFGCRYDDSGQRFAQWGDGADYVSIQNGAFESSYGWRLSGGAQLVDENEPFYLGSKSDQRSLLLPPGGSALSPAVCLQLLTPTIRFVGRSSDASAVHVTLYTRTLFGLLQLPTYGEMDLSTDWDASSIHSFVLENVLGILSLTRTNVYFKFTPVGDATVQMDDLYLDPRLWR